MGSGRRAVEPCDRGKEVLSQPRKGAEGLDRHQVQKKVRKGR